MPERRAITRDNVNAFFKLKVAPEQEHLVAPNEITLAQAPYEPAGEVWGIFEGEEPVGLFAIIDMARYPHPEPGDDRQSAYLWRLMIGAEHQGKGYGRFAIEECKSIARGWGLSRLTSSVVQAENSGMAFYEKLGFRQTGAVMDRELVITMTI